MYGLNPGFERNHFRAIEGTLDREYKGLFDIHNHNVLALEMMKSDCAAMEKLVEEQAAILESVRVASVRAHYAAEAASKYPSELPRPSLAGLTEDSATNGVSQDKEQPEQEAASVESAELPAVEEG